MSVLLVGDRFKCAGERGSIVEVLKILESSVYFTIFEGKENDVVSTYAAGTGRQTFLVNKMIEIDGKLHNPFDNDAFKAKVDMELQGMRQILRGYH